MEFEKGPVPVTQGYRAEVANRLRVARVAASGLFDTTGTFDIVNLGEKTTTSNTTPMWALNLLKFTYAEDGVWATKDGFLFVYHGRMTRSCRDRIEPVHVIDPGNVRYVNKSRTFISKVGKSGWVLNKRDWDDLLLYDPISNEQLEKILVDAEAGNKPPFFVDHSEFVKVEPGFAGRRVHVISFKGIPDTVVVDIENKQLVGRKIVPLLSTETWEPKAVVSNP